VEERIAVTEMANCILHIADSKERIIHMKNRLLWSCFWLVCLVIVVAITTRLWAMRLLGDAGIRQQVQIVLVTVAKREGWFVSDISIIHVEMDNVTVQYRQHIRGRDPKACYRIPLQTLELLPCDS
jgi:hypothetical protein